MIDLVLDPPFWAWLVLAGLLLIGELSTGTFLLLWPAAAAGLTGLAVRAPIGPDGFGAWLLFAVLSIALALGARALGIRSKMDVEDNRTFNAAESRIGQPVTALTDFQAGQGRVRLGDTDWSAKTEGPTQVREGSLLTVKAVDGTLLIVAPTDPTS